MTNIQHPKLAVNLSGIGERQTNLSGQQLTIVEVEGSEAGARAQRQPFIKLVANLSGRNIDASGARQLAVPGTGELQVAIKRLRKLQIRTGRCTQQVERQ